MSPATRSQNISIDKKCVEQITNDVSSAAFAAPRTMMVSKQGTMISKATRVKSAKDDGERQALSALSMWQHGCSRRQALDAMPRCFCFGDDDDQPFPVAWEYLSADDDQATSRVGPRAMLSDQFQPTLSGEPLAWYRPG